MARLAAALQGYERVGLDTSLFIYYFEPSPRYVALVDTVFELLARGALHGVTSVLTLMELVVKPLQMGRLDLADEYQALIATYPNLRIVDADRITAWLAAELRAAHRLRPIDAVHIAASLQHGATAFLTNDRRLRRVTELDVLLLEDFVDA